MANCSSCGTKQSFLKLETSLWQTLEGALLCPSCAARLSDPVEQARAASASGARLLQIVLPVSQTTAHVVAMVGAATTSTTTSHASVLDRIEAQGWRLEHASYVYRVTGSESRDKFLSSGQQEAIRGEIVGVYIFRSALGGEAVVAPSESESAAARPAEPQARTCPQCGKEVAPDATRCRWCLGTLS